MLYFVGFKVIIFLMNLFKYLINLIIIGVMDIW